MLELDADDWLDPDAVFVIKSYLKTLPLNTSVLYGNWRYWRQPSTEDVKFLKIQKGEPVNNQTELLSYIFPLGPRVYRTSALTEIKGFPTIDFEDVAVLVQLLKKHEFLYKDFTVYNIRKHSNSFTKKNHSTWSDLKKFLTDYD